MKLIIALEGFIGVTGIETVNRLNEIATGEKIIYQTLILCVAIYAMIKTKNKNNKQ